MRELYLRITTDPVAITIGDRWSCLKPKWANPTERSALQQLLGDRYNDDLEIQSGGQRRMLLWDRDLCLGVKAELRIVILPTAEARSIMHALFPYRYYPCYPVKIEDLSIGARLLTRGSPFRQRN